MKKVFLLAVLTCFVAFVFAAEQAKRYGTWGIDTAGMDTSVKPGDNFYGYVNGKWAASTQIPADKTSYGSFQMLMDVSEAQVHAILDQWAADKNLKAGSDEAKAAAIYRAFLDEATAERLDAMPLQPYLNALKQAKTKEAIAHFIGSKWRGGFGASPFRPFVDDDQKHPDIYALYFVQSGLGLPDREYYLRDNFKPQRERYQKYIAEILRLAGWNDPDKNAADIIAFETKIAEAHWTRSESRDRDKTYNLVTIDELEKSAPEFPWRNVLKEAGCDKADKLILRQNTAIMKLANIYGVTPATTLQAWEVFHVVDQVAPYLSKRFVNANWEFQDKFLNGIPEQRPRWKRAVSAVEASLGEAIGRRYVELYFPPESKRKMEALVSDLRTALKARIDRLEWMSQETKTSAQQKLTRFSVKIGYPVKWRDYTALQIKDGDLVGNMERSSTFETTRRAKRLGKPVDKDEWDMTPQTVNAYYNSTKNEIVFPAAILQPPFFDPQADPAVNYGGIGAVIGHEITHGFDDQGRKSDGNGVLRDWWAPEDAKKFEAQAVKLGAQYEALNFPELPALHIIGKQTMGENIGDLGGVLLALDAYHLSLKGQPAPVIDGFNGDQRVFLGWAQVWRTLMRPDALRQQLMTNPHSPGKVRSFAPLRNIDSWYTAFGVREGDANYIKPEDRVRIW